jgi:N-acetylmuramoyl-L-alanine amidase
MFPAALRLGWILSLLALSAAAEPNSRAAPRRPASVGTPPSTAPSAVVRRMTLANTRIGNVDYVSLRDVAVLLDCKIVWKERERQLTLVGLTFRAEFTADSREVNVDGLRLFLGHPALMHGGKLYLSRLDLEHNVIGRLRPALAVPFLSRPHVIALDPGHGGADNGMENKRLGLKEKILTLDVAQRLQKLLVARGYTVVLTRTDDRSLAVDKTTDFRRRDEIANRAGADLFVSIHFNSLYPDTKTSGTETYAFTPQFQQSDRAWSPREPDDTERDAAPVNRYDAWSGLLAQSIHREVVRRLQTVDRGQKTMHSAVLRALDCPAVLVESLFLSNDPEAMRVLSAAGRQRIAEALAAGIDNYADTVAALQPKPPRSTDRSP